MKILDGQGWKLVDRCGCGGRSQKIYRHDKRSGYEMKIYVDEVKWTLYLHNRKLASGDESELLCKMIELGLV